MPLTALALVLCAALLHAGWNLAAKQASTDRHFVMWGLLAVLVLWLPAALVLGLDEWRRWSAAFWGVALVSGLLHLAYFNVLMTGYRLSDLGVVYPVARGSGPLITAVVATALLGEPLGLPGAAGVLAVCSGVFLIAGGPALWRGPADPARHAHVQAGLRWGAATGALIAGYSVVDGWAVKHLGMSPLPLDVVGNLLRLPVMLALTLRAPQGFMASGRRWWKQILVLGALSPLAYILVLQAVRQAPLSHVAPAREISMLFAALIGGRLLGEGNRGLRLAGAALMALGVVLLAAG